MINEFWVRYKSDSIKNRIFDDERIAIAYAESHNVVSSVQHWIFDDNHKNPRCIGKIWKRL